MPEPDTSCGLHIRDVLDKQHDLPKTVRERRRKASERTPGDRIDVVLRGHSARQALGGCHGCRIGAGEAGRQGCPAMRPCLHERPSRACGAVAEWSKALAWKVSIRQNRIEGSNPSRSAKIC